MARAIYLALVAATLVFSLGHVSATGGFFNAQGVTEATNPLYIQIFRSPDQINDPPATWGVPSEVTVVIMDLLGDAVEVETFYAEDNYNPTATEPGPYEFNTREPLRVHYHGQGIQAGEGGVTFTGHFEGSAGVHHGFTVVSFFTPGPPPSP